MRPLLCYRTISCPDESFTLAHNQQDSQHTEVTNDICHLPECVDPCYCLPTVFSALPLVLPDRGIVNAVFCNNYCRTADT